MNIFISIFLAVVALSDFGVYSELTCPPLAERNGVLHVWNQERFNPRGIYIPIMGKKNAEILAKLSNVSEEHLSQLACPRLIQEDGLVKYADFEKVTPFKCVVDGQNNTWRSTCIPVDINNSGGVTKSQAWVVLTNNIDYGLALSCVDETFFTWNVFSTLPVLTKEKLTEILKELTKHGFDKKETLSIHYEFCDRCNCMK